MAHKNEEKWNGLFEIYKEYISEFGRFPPANEVYKKIKLGAWFTNQVSFYRHGTLPSNRLAKMDSLNPFWKEYFDDRKTEASKMILSSNWKGKLLPGDVPIDEVFTGEDLHVCLSHGIYSCRGYFEYIQKTRIRDPWRADHQCSKPKWGASLFSFECRRAVFEKQFPDIDFHCFNIRCVAFGFHEPIYDDDELFIGRSNNACKYFAAACLLSKYNPFRSADEMRKTFCSVLDTLTPQQKEVLAYKFFKGLSRLDIAEKCGLSRERIRQVENNALLALRLPYRSKQLVGSLHNRLSAGKANELLRFGNGSINLSGSQYEFLPTDLHIPGDLDLSRSAIRVLPKGLCVDGTLNLSFTEIYSLSPDTKVCGSVIFFTVPQPADEIISSTSSLNSKLQVLTIGELGFSTRTTNCLRKAHLKTAEELLSLSDQDFLRIPNLGITCLKEIKEKLLTIEEEINAEENEKDFGYSDIAPSSNSAPLSLAEKISNAQSRTSCVPDIIALSCTHRVDRIPTHE